MRLNPPAALPALLWPAAAFATAAVLTYLNIGRGMTLTFYGVIFVLFFLVCFFSIKISLILLIMSMLLSPEVAVASTSQRAVTVRFEDILLLIMTVGWLARMAIFKDIGLLVKSPLTVPIMAYSGIAVLSTLLGIARGDVRAAAGIFFTLKILEYFFVFLVVVNYVKDEREISQFLTALLAVSGIVTLYSLFQVVAGGDIAAPFEGEAGEKNTLGGYLVFMGCIAGGVLLHASSMNERVLLGGQVVMVIVVLLFSLSRSSWMSAVTAVLILFAFGPHKKVFFSILLLTVLVFPLVVPQVTLERFWYTFTEPFAPGQQVTVGGVRLDMSTSARLISYQYVMDAILKHPFFGYGITGFTFIDGQFFRTLVELGFIGIIAFFWLMGGIHRILWRAMRSDFPPRFTGMALGGYAGFWAMMVHALSANTFIIVRIAEPFWCLVGLVTALMVSRETPVLSPGGTAGGAAPGGTVEESVAPADGEGYIQEEPATDRPGGS